jgi:hypothetical protein
VLESIKQSSWRVKWNLREIFKVTQWKDDCVYRTRSLGMLVCTREYADSLGADKDIIITPVSTKISKELM